MRTQLLASAVALCVACGEHPREEGLFAACEPDPSKRSIEPGAW